MKILILAIIFISLCMTACSQPPVGEEFSPKKKKMVKFSRIILLCVAVAAVLLMGYNSIYGERPDDFEIDTKPYAVILKTDGHRMLSFKDPLESRTLFGEEAEMVMESAFGNVTKGRFISWNDSASWMGKYSVKVYYTEEDYERYLNNQMPLEIRRNSFENGKMFFFNILENGKVYVSGVGTKAKPVYQTKITGDAKELLFP
ncbi:MAG: hypothetical protein IJF53_02240 [Clostridia bacterium]|nr:hypothetical protein [Clostridia bacterium]